MLARALPALVLWAGGCRQVFGIDDTEVAEVHDASPPAVDMARAAPCTFAIMTAANRLCLEFEEPLGDGMASDGSGHGNHASVSGVRSAARQGPADLAVEVDARSEIHVGETGTLDLDDQLTIELWALLYAAPGTRVTLVDNDFQYGVHITPSRTVNCSIFTSGPNSLETSPMEPFPLGAWTHVACVYDGTTLAIHVDGSRAAEASVMGSVNTDSMLGVQVGQNLVTGGGIDGQLVGQLDDVRIWAAALGPAQLCTVAGPFGDTSMGCP